MGWYETDPSAALLAELRRQEVRRSLHAMGARSVDLRGWAPPQSVAIVRIDREGIELDKLVGRVEALEARGGRERGGGGRSKEAPPVLRLSGRVRSLERRGIDLPPLHGHGVTRGAAPQANSGPLREVRVRPPGVAFRASCRECGRGGSVYKRRR